MTNFFVYSSEIQDADVRLWCVDAHGRTACLLLAFKPSFFVELLSSSPTTTTAEAYRIQDELKASKVSVVERKRFVGFDGRVSRAWAHVSFESAKRFFIARKVARETAMSTANANVDPLLQFFHSARIDPVGWVDVRAPVAKDAQISRGDVVEYRVSPNDLSASTSTDVPRLVVASWDIECISSTGGFPNGNVVGDQIITIGTSYALYGSNEPFKRTVHQLGTLNDVDGVEVHPYDDEATLINAWIAETRQAHVLLGYNVWGFDSAYIEARTGVLLSRWGEKLVDTTRFGLAREGGGVFTKKELQSGAYGANSYEFHATPGQLQLDLLTVYRKELKLESYTLDNVSRTFLGDLHKIDLKPNEIFRLQALEGEEGVQGRTRIAEYCVRDTELPLRLLHKLNTLMNHFEMARVVCVPVEYLLLRGQQIRCFSQIVRMANDHGFVVQDDAKGSGEGSDEIGYVGATVLEPRKGAYMDDIVSGLDFASLYPSIMRAHTMCPSTIVLHDAYAALDGVEYYEIETTPGRTVRFAQDPSAVVPRLLDNLAAWRKASKRDMVDAKQRGDAFAASLHDAKQLAYKVSMNSIYGFFGSKFGFISLVDLASAVTTTGRQMISATKAYCEDRGHTVVYGDTDSVMVILKLGEANRLNRAAHMAAARALAAEITAALFKAPNDLEFEKIYSPYLIFSKKRYAALMYEDDPDTPTKVDVKGLQLVRRDNAPIVRRVSKRMLDILMYERSFERALEYAQQEIAKVIDGNIVWDEFVVSKALRGGYKNPDSLPHVIVARKRTQRGNPPYTGERVPFVYLIDPDEADQLQSKRAEDPAYAIEHNLELDLLHYVNQQLISPLATLLSLKYADAAQQLIAPVADKIVTMQADALRRAKDAKNRRYRVDNRIKDIRSFFGGKP